MSLLAAFETPIEECGPTEVVVNNTYFRRHNKLTRNIQGAYMRYKLAYSDLEVYKYYTGDRNENLLD